jgi:hypothetical protein
MTVQTPREDGRDPKETERLRDEVVRRMLNTPPKPHPKPKPGRRRGRPVGT